jgi:DNA-3-methyladenine glycosylase I
MVENNDTKKRCAWCDDNPLYIDYHDNEWGVPVHDERLLFEFLILEGAQAGLSWITILKKRDNYRKAFDNFDYKKVAKFGDDDFNRLMADAGIIRNSLKIKSAIQNAKAFVQVQEEFGSFDKYIWGFVDGLTIHNKWKSINDMPTKTDISEKMSKDLKKRGFKFVGSTICYAFMQAIGMVNDHTLDCYRYKEIKNYLCKNR